MKKFILPVLIFVAACATVPYTNRRQLSLIDEGQASKMGEEAYAQVLKENPRSDNAQYQAMIKSVGERISLAANKPDFKWEFNVLKSTQVNAFCLPGGKVAFYDSIIPICKDETGVAVVMGHEVAHALANHSAERMSQGLGAELVGQVLGAGLSKASPAIQQNVMQLYGLGANYGVILPFSRQQESEADHIGLILMSKAGYDPRAALAFWERMESTGGQAPPEFLSTHPSGSTRIAQIKQWLPEVLPLYEQSKR
jgi:predicted Zn-dependent protease